MTLVAQMIKESICNAGDPSSILGSGFSRDFPLDRLLTPVFMDFPSGSDGKESACSAGDLGLIPGLGRVPSRWAWQPTPVFLPGESPWTEEPGWATVHRVIVGHD